MQSSRHLQVSHAGSQWWRWNFIVTQLWVITVYGCKQWSEEEERFLPPSLGSHQEVNFDVEDVSLSDKYQINKNNKTGEPTLSLSLFLNKFSHPPKRRLCLTKMLLSRFSVIKNSMFVFRIHSSSVSLILNYFLMLDCANMHPAQTAIANPEELFKVNIFLHLCKKVYNY